MGKTDRLSERQLTILLFVSLLSPMIRILPTAAVVFAGRAAWLSPPVALAMAGVPLALTRAARRRANPGEGLAELIIRGLGKVGGRIFCAAAALWLTFYGGFIARSAAERLLATVYPNGGPGIFIAVMLGVALITGSGLTKNLARTAEVLMPVLVAVIAVVLFSAAPDVETVNLLPVTLRDGPGILFGALPIFNVLTAFEYFLFLSGHVEQNGAKKPRRFPWMPTLAAVALAVTFFTLGTLGEALSVSMENAFFMLIRNIRIFGVVERVESVVVAIWIVTDFIFLGAVIMVVSEIWRSVTGVKRRQAFVPPTAALSGAAAFLITGGAFELQRWSDTLIPAINMSFTVILIPGALLITMLRKK